MSICDDPATDLEQTVAQFYRTLAASLDREPRVATAMLADMFGDPSGPAARLFATDLPRVLVSIGGWLQTEVQAGRIRDIPIDVLLQQLIGPLLAHMLMRPALTAGSPNAPTLEQACSTFAAAFLRAVGAQQPTEAIPEE